MSDIVNHYTVNPFSILQCFFKDLLSCKICLFDYILLYPKGYRIVNKAKYQDTMLHYHIYIMYYTWILFIFTRPNWLALSNVVVEDLVTLPANTSLSFPLNPWFYSNDDTGFAHVVTLTLLPSSMWQRTETELNIGSVLRVQIWLQTGKSTLEDQCACLQNLHCCIFYDHHTFLRYFSCP